MVEHTRRTGEDGTTLVELLVVITILAIISTVTTVGIVTGFRAQLTAANVAETLDGTRIATQRVRDFVRGATEVCANSTQDSLVLWTDDDDDGTIVDAELDIFELVADAGGDDVFQRRTPTSTGDEIQLIRDDIINAALFVYDTGSATDQPDDLVCKQGETVSNGASVVRVVTVEFQVENPDPAEPPLTTTTSVRLRNADLVDGPSNAPPTAAFSVSCPDPDNVCEFDASASNDDDGTIQSYEWTFFDTDGVTVLGTSTGETTTFEYSSNTQAGLSYPVTLVVTDDDGDATSFEESASPVPPGANAPPTADFTFTCSGRVCDFDAGPSDDDSAIVSYGWTFGAVGSDTGETVQFTFPEDKDYGVTLTVEDDDGDTDSITKTVTASSTAIYVSSLTGQKKSSGNKAEFTVQLSLTTAGNPGDGILVTISADRADGAALEQSCSTNNGGCTVEFSSGINKNTSYPLTATVESVTQTGSYTYDEDQNTDDTETLNQ